MPIIMFLGGVLIVSSRFFTFFLDTAEDLNLRRFRHRVPQINMRTTAKQFYLINFQSPLLDFWFFIGSSHTGYQRINLLFAL